MAEGRQRSEWTQTAALLAMTAEINRDRRKRSEPYTVADFDPFAEPAATPTADITVLRDVFVKNPARPKPTAKDSNGRSP